MPYSNPRLSEFFMQGIYQKNQTSELWKSVHIATQTPCIIYIKNRRYITTKAAIRKDLSHPGIVALKDYFSYQLFEYQILEDFSNYRTLLQVLVVSGPIKEPNLSNFTKQLLHGLEYLHKNNITLCDLSPENIVVSGLSVTPNSSHTLKISGFNHAVQDSYSCNMTGYPILFLAPEILESQYCSEKSDMWSLGAITYLMCCGYPPFYDECQDRLFMQLIEGEYKFHKPYWNNISESVKNFIRNLILVNGSQRLLASEALNHHFVNPKANIPIEIKEFPRKKRGSKGSLRSAKSIAESISSSISAASSSLAYGMGKFTSFLGFMKGRKAGSVKSKNSIQSEVFESYATLNQRKNLSIPNFDILDHACDLNPAEIQEAYESSLSEYEMGQEADVGAQKARVGQDSSAQQGKPVDLNVLYIDVPVENIVQVASDTPSICAPALSQQESDIYENLKELKNESFEIDWDIGFPNTSINVNIKSEENDLESSPDAPAWSYIESKKHAYKLLYK